MKITKVTPILYVEEIEPSLSFWRDRLEFQITTEVPQDDCLGFVILERDGMELMMQPRAGGPHHRLRRVPALTPLGLRA